MKNNQITQRAVINEGGSRPLISFSYYQEGGTKILYSIQRGSPELFIYEYPVLEVQREPAGKLG